MKHFAACIDYFSKWSEEKRIKDSTIALLLMSVWLYEDWHLQGREFVNEVSKVLHKMIVTLQCITLVYHPQSNGLSEQQNINGGS